MVEHRKRNRRVTEDHLLLVGARHNTILSLDHLPDRVGDPVGPGINGRNLAVVHSLKLDFELAVTVLERGRIG
jgi:hypothetical protein